MALEILALVGLGVFVLPIMFYLCAKLATYGVLKAKKQFEQDHKRE